MGATTYVRRPGERNLNPVRKGKVYVPQWVDPYWWIQGSSIEKMVMAEFVRRGIYFEHTPQKNTLPWPSWLVEEKHPENWEPDFLLPQYRIWLEINGAYFHTLPGAVEADALRMAAVEMVGWKALVWWEDDIRVRLQDLFNQVPEFYMVNRALESEQQKSRRRTDALPFFEGGDGIDHLAGLRTALRNRGRPPQGVVKRYRKRRRPK